jgi:hypothetical protein
MIWGMLMPSPLCTHPGAGWAILTAIVASSARVRVKNGTIPAPRCRSLGSSTIAVIKTKPAIPTTSGIPILPHPEALDTCGHTLHSETVSGCCIATVALIPPFIRSPADAHETTMASGMAQIEGDRGILSTARPYSGEVFSEGVPEPIEPMFGNSTPLPATRWEDRQKSRPNRPW